MTCCIFVDADDGLTMHVKFQLVMINLRVFLHGCLDEFPPHMLEPYDVGLFQIAEAPEISPLDDCQQMEARQSLPVPIQIRCKQKGFLFCSVLAWVAEDDILLLFATFEDIEHPV